MRESFPVNKNLSKASFPGFILPYIPCSHSFINQPTPTSCLERVMAVSGDPDVFRYLKCCEKCQI